MAAELQEKEQRPIDSRPLPDGKKFHVFISYSESDRSWVETVIQHLQNDYNFKCFEHSTDFIPGRKIRENIEYAILNSVKTLCVITEDYNQSFWCQFEVEFAILKLLAEMKENVIIPVLKEECEIPGYLKPFTYINGTGDMNVWLPKLASAIELEGEQYNHELALNRVKNAVNRNRNLDLLHEETSHINCRGPVFRWKYVPESLSIAPMKVNSEQYNEVIKTISSKHLVIGRHCRNLWWPTICFAVTIVIPTLFIGLLFTVVTIDSHYYTPSGILFAFPALAVLWLAMCGCSDYWGRREMKITLREVNRRLLPNKVMVTYKRQRTTATFTICFLFFDMTSCVNHMASELHNKRIRESLTREMVALDMNDDDDEALVDDIPGDSEAYNEQNWTLEVIEKNTKTQIENNTKTQIGTPIILSETMTSMSSLKSKLHKLKKEDTSEVTDYKTWMRKITDCGNRAEDWLEYTTYMRHNLNFNDRFQAHNFLSDLYEKAFRAIDGKANKDNEAFAHLFIDFAEVKSEQLLLEDAIQLLTEARNIVKRYAIVHIASAELEVKEGNISKARNILNKARLFKFEPTELLVEALKKLDAGETILLSPRHRRYSSSQSKVNLSDDSQSIFHGGAPEGNLQEHIGPDEMETAPVMMESHKEKYVTVRANSCRPAMRSYSSTPEMRSLTNLQWKRKDIGVPQRVRKLNLPFTTTAEEEEDEEGVEDMDTMAGFTPLEPQASSTFVSMTTAQSSGYQSMMETTIPLETGNQFENNLFHSGKQEFDLSGIHPQKQAFDLSEIHPQKQAFDLSEIHPQKQTFNLSGIHPQKQILDMSGIHPQRQTCDLSGILSQRQTCDLSSKQSKSLKEPTKSDNVSLLQPNGRPQIMKSQALPDTKSNLVSSNQVSANPTPSRGASRVVTPNQMSDFPTLSRGGPIVVSPNQVSGNPTPNGGAPRVVTPNQVSANPAPNRGAPKVVTPNQVSANLHPNRRVPELPTPNRSIEPTPSKHVMSDRLSNVPICATPSAVQQTSIPCTPSVMQDVETITVNNVVYMILDLLGKGGSSKVYHVHDSKPPSKALKVVNLNDANEEIVNGYKNEVKLLLQLQYCPKVIKLYDYEYRPEENKLYIVMEYGNCDFAQFLKDKIKEDCKLSDHLIKYYWESMLMAVHALHKEGIIHSDLKPSNFIIIGGALKLIDFGIAKSVQPDKTSVLTEMQVGTLNYMSPESIADYGLDEKPMYKIGVKSDVWSLGCILYNMVYGFTPFQRINKQFAKLQAITNSSYVIHFPEIEDKRLLDVMKKCLIRDPKVRPSIEDLLHHPYLKREKKEEPSVVDKRIERLVERLADKVSSPNTLRSLLRSEILKGMSAERDCPENKENVH